MSRSGATTDTEVHAMQDELYGRWLDWDVVDVTTAEIDLRVEACRRYFQQVGVEELLAFMCDPTTIPASSGSSERAR